MLGQAHHIYSTLFLNFSTVAAGMGALAPVVALMIFSKRASVKKVAKVAVMPAVFNIAEPVLFGLPIILNPIYFIPWVITWPIDFYIGIFFTKIGFIAPIVNNVPWTVPTLISGLLYTGSINGLIVQLIIFVVTVVIYVPFIKMDNRINADESKQLEDQATAEL